MTRYLIKSQETTSSLTEQGDAVTEASHEIQWAIGLQFQTVRNYCQQQGWEVIPIIPNYHDTI